MFRFNLNLKKKIITAVLITGFCFGGLNLNAAAATSAHWIFQNDPAFVSGDISGNNFAVKDVSGNGNELIVKSQGAVNAEQLSWANGYDGAKTSLLFNNQINFADKSNTDSFVNTVPVAKWLETVSSAPINQETFKSGFTIEIIFRLTEDYLGSYNRYSNFIERQGTVMGKYGEGATDPLFALATTESLESDAILDSSNPIGTQLLQMSEDGQAWHNIESPQDIEPNKWYHMAAVNNGTETIVYINGEEVMAGDVTGIATAGYGWDIGIGRKYNDKNDSKLGNDPIGVVRRALCGQIAEIKISDNAVAAAQFISNAKTNIGTFTGGNANETVSVVTPTEPIETIVAPIVQVEATQAQTQSQSTAIAPVTGDLPIMPLGLLAAIIAVGVVWTKRAR